VINQSAVSPLITSDLLARIQSFYPLKWNGVHGISHWQRVRINGLMLAEMNGANRKVVEYFAFCHDCQRQNEGFDPEHGMRASNKVRSDLGAFLDLDNDELELLCYACNLHADGFTEGDITVQTCWDSDRLDLMRVGIMPNKKYLCTELAKQDAMILSAIARSRNLLEVIAK
jgi:uncharacterized protein